MFEWIVLDNAPIFPHNCTGCLSQKPPFLDTHREQGGLRIYLCQECIKRGARILGFIEGTRMDELARANEDLAARNLDVANLLAEVKATSDMLATEHATNSQLTETLGDRDAYIANLERQIRASAATALSAVAD